LDCSRGILPSRVPRMCCVHFPPSLHRLHPRLPFARLRAASGSSGSRGQSSGGILCGSAPLGGGGSSFPALVTGGLGGDERLRRVAATGGLRTAASGSSCSRGAGAGAGGGAGRAGAGGGAGPGGDATASSGAESRLVLRLLGRTSAIGFQYPQQLVKVSAIRLFRWRTCAFFGI
jgi:hypothetical protein